MKPAFIAAALLLAEPAAAARMLSLDVIRSGDSYGAEFEAELEAPVAAVYAVLTDYEQIPRLSPVVRGVTVTATGEPGVARVRSELESCVLFFCRRMVQVQEIREEGGYRLSSRMIAQGSDFSAGSSQWRLEARGANTYLYHRTTKTPGFFVPPLIGPWAIQRRLREHAEDGVQRLEALARQATLGPFSGQAAPGR